MVTSIYGHNDMLDYLSDYKTQDKYKGVHYHPSGALCWFETNRYGDPTGAVYYVRKIPVKELLYKPWEERGYKKLLRQRSERKSIKDALTKEMADTEQWQTVKPRFHE